jgi:hypothetical protein
MIVSQTAKAREADDIAVRSGMHFLVATSRRPCLSSI